MQWTYLDRHKEALVVNPAWEIWPSADMASSLITFDGWAATTVRRALSLTAGRPQELFATPLM